MRPVLGVLLAALALGGSPSPSPAQPAAIFPRPAGTDVAWGWEMLALGTDVLVEAPFADVGGAPAGVLHLFDGATGALTRVIPHPVPAAGNLFAGGLAVEDDLLLVGARYDNTAGPEAGAAYLLDLPTGSLLQMFLNPTPELDTFGSNDAFGGSLLLHDGSAFIGAALDDTMGHNAGAVYRFDVATGALLDTFYGPSPLAFALFGSSLVMHGGELLVGAPGGFHLNSTAGTVYRLDPATGALLGTIPSPAPLVLGEFGARMVRLGGDLVVSAPHVQAVYRLDGTSFTLVQTFLAPIPSGYFGFTLAAAGNLVAVGSYGETAGGEFESGAVHLFDATTGLRVRSIPNPTPGDTDHFGVAMALAGDRIVVGSWRDATQTPAGQGTTFAFCGGAAGCAPCQTCGPLGTCVTAPHPTCRALPSGSMRLGLRHGATDAGDVLTWSGAGAPAGPADVPVAAEFGDPTDARFVHDYSLCLYDESAPAPVLVGRFTAPAASACGTVPCWTVRGPVKRGFLYRDRTGSRDGLRRVEVTNVAGRRTLGVKGRGALLATAPLGLPTPPLGLPLRVQLQVKDGICWEATYGTASRNVAGGFRARSD